MNNYKMSEKKHIEKGALILTAILIMFVGYVAYQSFVVIPRERLAQDKAKTELVIQQAQEQDQKFNSCIKIAETNYSETWDSNCRRIAGKVPCALNMTLANSLNDTIAGDKRNCIAAYK